MRPKFALVCLLLISLAGCGTQTEKSGGDTTAAYAEETADVNSSTIFAMDTVMDLTIYGDAAVLDHAEERILHLESLFSVTDPASEIYTLDHTGACVLSEETGELLEQALALCGRTGGALDISIYPVVRAWGFTTGSYQIPSDEEISELLESVDYTKIQYDPITKTAQLPDDMEIDLGSIAKGYTGDKLIELLRNSGVSSALINLGGNVQTLGSKPDGSPWRIAVRDPMGDGYIGILEAVDKAVITSGGYERYFEQDGEVYWHIIDPSTGQPAKNGLLSVTIVGDSGALCDALSTSLFVMGAEDAAAFWRSSDDFEAVFVDEGGNITITEGLENSFSLSSSQAGASVSVLRRD